MYPFISSAANPKVKFLRSLMEKSRERKSNNLFVADGWKEILMAFEAGYSAESIFFRKGFSPDDVSLIANDLECFETDTDLFDKLSYRDATSGAIGIFNAKTLTLDDIKLSEKPLILIADEVEKPGNLGAMLRTADATGADAVICCDIATDIFNPNVIRSSVGCVFSVQTVAAERNEVLHWLKKNNICIYTTSLKASVAYTAVSYQPACAIVLGTEASGVNEVWENESNANIILPMLGKNDSLNVSNTAAVVLYEALRQRGL